MEYMWNFILLWWFATKHFLSQILATFDAHNKTKFCIKITNTGLLTYIEDLHFLPAQLLPLLSPSHGEGLLFNVHWAGTRNRNRKGEIRGSMEFPWNNIFIFCTWWKTVFGKPFQKNLLRLLKKLIVGYLHREFLSFYETFCPKNMRFIFNWH